MKQFLALAVLAALFITGALSEGASVTHPEEVLDIPGGRAVAILLPGAPRRVLEEKNGYVRVAVEGWIRIPRPLAAGAGEPAPVSDGSTAPIRSEVSLQPGTPVQGATTLAGRIIIRIASGEIRYGAGGRVLALGSVEELEARRGSLAAAYQTERRDLQEQIQSLQNEKAGALSSSENLNQATRRLDRAKAGLAQKNLDLQALEVKVAAREAALVEEFRIAETFADSNGAYSLGSLPAGACRIWAVFSDSGLTYRWYVSATLSEGKADTLDLTAAKAGENPFLQAP